MTTLAEAERQAALHGVRLTAADRDALGKVEANPGQQGAGAGSGQVAGGILHKDGKDPATVPHLNIGAQLRRPDVSLGQDLIIADGIGTDPRRTGEGHHRCEGGGHGFTTWELHRFYGLLRFSLNRSFNSTSAPLSLSRALFLCRNLAVRRCIVPPSYRMG